MAKAAAYECPSCGAALALDPETQMLACAYCGSSYSVEEISKIQREKYGIEGAASEESSEQKPEEPRKESKKKSRSEWSDFDLGFEAREMQGVVYNCVNCGADVVTDGVTAATVCPYCDSALVVNERMSGGLQPAAIIPFKIPKEDLAQLLQDFYKNKPLLPKDFFAKNKVEKAQGVYVPFWLFDGELHGDARYDAENVLTYVSGDYDVVETQHYVLAREGNVTFEAIPVDGSDRMDDDVMDSIEPFDYSGICDFDPAYLSGFVADRFDKGPDDVFDRAKLRMHNSADEVFRATCTGYAMVNPSKLDFSLVDGSVQYVMLPVYLFNTEYDGKKYRYAINGQTGKVVGEVPIGKRESRMAFLKPTIISAVIAFAALVAGSFMMLS